MELCHLLFSFKFAQLIIRYQEFIILPEDEIYEALKKIDINKKKFLIVVNESKELLGVLTDGDIRRAFIRGKAVNDTLEDIYTDRCQYLNLSDGMAGAINKFKDKRLDFLPIVDERKRLINIITKKQMQALLLQDIYANLDYNFLNVKEDIIDYEVSPREWGFYKTTFINDYFQSKIINLNPNSKLSLQSHMLRDEYWIVVHGEGKVQIEDVTEDAKYGDTFYIPKTYKHRLINCSNRRNLIVVEIQLGDYFGEDDIVRYEDIYGRI